MTKGKSASSGHTFSELGWCLKCKRNKNEPELQEKCEVEINKVREEGGL